MRRISERLQNILLTLSRITHCRGFRSVHHSDPVQTRKASLYSSHYQYHRKQRLDGRYISKANQLHLIFGGADYLVVHFLADQWTRCCGSHGLIDHDERRRGEESSADKHNESVCLVNEDQCFVVTRTALVNRYTFENRSRQM